MRGIIQSYFLRILRRHLLWRSFRSRHKLTSISDRTESIGDDAILAVSVVRNENLRLPHFLQHYRDLGVTHFLIVDNESTDGTQDYLKSQSDVSLWSTGAGYKAARFGLDWATWLLMHYGKNKWCLTVDADELLIYPNHESRDLRALTSHLDSKGVRGLGAFMLDLYPDGPVDRTPYTRGDDPLDILTHFDAEGYHAQRQMPRGNLWLQGGARERVFFSDRSEKGPTLNKIPLVKWHWRYAYINSTHSILPANMNALYDGPWDTRLSGVLLHTKFLHCVVEKSVEDLDRQQHFRRPEEFTDYNREIAAAPNLMFEGSVRFQGAAQLEKAGLLSRGDWL